MFLYCFASNTNHLGGPDQPKQQHTNFLNKQTAGISTQKDLTYSQAQILHSVVLVVRIIWGRGALIEF